MRLACIALSDFAVWSRRRHDPTLRGVPLAIAGERGPLLALSPEARRRGLRLTMTATQAQAVLPETRFLPPEPALEEEEERLINRLLLGFSPRVEREPGRHHGALRQYLDLAGLGRLYGLEPELARRVHQALRRLGYPATIGVASSKLVAAIAAAIARNAPGRVRVIPPGDEPAFLAPLPLARLPFASEIRNALAALGLVTIGDWMALPAETIAARFGTEAARLHALARGLCEGESDGAPLTPSPPPPPLALAIDLDEAVTDLEILTFSLKQALERLCTRLVGLGLEAAVVRVVLHLDDHSRAICESRLAHPTQHARLLLDCLRLELARQSLAAPVRRFQLELRETAPIHADQLQLFPRRSERDPAVVETALARIRALVGPDGVTSPRPADAHRPEAQLLWVPYEPTERRPPATPRLPRVHPRADDPPGPVLGPLPARLLPAPEPAEVRTLGGRPASLAFDYLRTAVTATSGPHRLEGEWWDEEVVRDYWQVRSKDGERYWLYAEGERWFVQGVFD